MLTHFTRSSSNAKTGPIPVSTSSARTCPDNCSLKGSGCYAETGPLSWHWKKITNGDRGSDWTTFLDEIKDLPNGQLWRHNVAGDLAHYNGIIDFDKLYQLYTANLGKRGFTYTHHDMMDERNQLSVYQANQAGFTVNLSADNLEQADKLADYDIGPVVAVLPSTQTKNTTTPKGRKVVVCPATQKDNVTCASCKLCAIADRTAIIGFPAHGTRKKIIDIKLVK